MILIGDDLDEGREEQGSGGQLDILVYEHVTGGGLAGRDLPASWAVEGRAIRRTLASDFARVAGVRVTMPLDARLADEPGPWTVIRIGPDQGVEVVAMLASRADYTVLIAPETDGILENLTRTIADRGGRSLGPTAAAVSLTADKFRLGEHLLRLGLRTPSVRLVRPRAGLPRDAAYPAVLKPVDGAGAGDTFFIESADDPLVGFFPNDIGLLQPWIQGEPRSATFLNLDGGGPILVGVGTQRLDREGGRIVYQGGAILDDSMPVDHPTRLAVARIPGLNGLVGVDYVHDPKTGRATLIEINPRPTTSIVGLVAVLGAGRLAGIWLGTERIASNRSVEPLARPASPLTFGADGSIRSNESPLDRTPRS